MQISSQFYENHAAHFSDTRFCIWDVVRDFGDKRFTKGTHILDVGCGNGKNMNYFKEKCNIVGIDKSDSLTTICNSRGLNVCTADISNIPYPDNTFDHIICIAVIHHIDSEEKRISAVNEMLRVLKPGGHILVTVWAYESDEYSKKKKFNLGDNIVSFGKENASRYYYIYNEIWFLNFMNSIQCSNKECMWERGNWNAIFVK
jgi:ubiquinone/menaquinone biosynthesis C-methylase UbiE